ncbi:MAG: GNAT family N-acetyltransferase [Parachlamydia sp.]|nr:GNAT family N-acetyltransferase [Parachlamydia sp.]
MDGARLPPFPGTHQTHISTPTHARLPSLNELFQEAVQDLPRFPLPRFPLASISEHTVVQLSYDMPVQPEWSDILPNDFPEIPDTFLVKLPDEGPPLTPLQICFKTPLPVIKPSPNNPIGELFHQSREIPPLVGLSLKHGDIPLDASLSHNTATQLLFHYFKIRSLNDDEVQQLFEACFQDPIIAECLLLPALITKGVVLRSPLAREFPAIQSLLSDYPVEALQQRQDVMDGRLFLITPLYLPFSPSGVIVMDILPRPEGSICRIESLNISENERRKGWGTLLINYAVFWACRMQCREIQIEATPQNLIFCLRLGFRPIHPLLNAENWQGLRFAFQLAYTHNYCLTRSQVLTLPLNEYNHTYEGMRQKVLDPDYAKRWPTKDYFLAGAS